MSFASAQALRDGMRQARWDTADLWVASVAMGGNLRQRDIELVALGTADLTPADHDVLAAALNDYFTDRGEDHPVRYWRDLPDA
jgi:hypothetical protein